ncbi:MAG: hypothetical protein U5R48_12390 [Gammaproteobacteria bacterium]|nr:hypothetical protein [Gammaproteobacteria bacterium]
MAEASRSAWFVPVFQQVLDQGRQLGSVDARAVQVRLGHEAALLQKGCAADVGRGFKGQEERVHS